MEEIIDLISKTFDCIIEKCESYRYSWNIRFKYFDIRLCYFQKFQVYQMFDIQNTPNWQSTKIFDFKHQYIELKKHQNRVGFSELYCGINQDYVIQVLKDMYSLIYQLLNCNHPKEIKII